MALITPLRPPTIPHDPILVAVLPTHAINLPIVATVAYQSHPVVHLVTLLWTVQEVFGQDSTRVRLQHASRVYGDTYWLPGKLSSNFIICHHVFLNHGYISKVSPLLHCILTISLIATICVRVVIFEHDSIALHVLVCLVHPAALADKVLRVTIHQLLNRVLLQGACWLSASQHG